MEADPESVSDKFDAERRLLAFCFEIFQGRCAVFFINSELVWSGRSGRLPIVSKNICGNAGFGVVNQIGDHAQ